VLAHIPLGRLNPIEILIQQGDSRIAVVAEKTPDLASCVIVVDIEMLKKNNLIPRVFRDSAVLPVAVADCAAFLLQKQEPFQLGHRHPIGPAVVVLPHPLSASLAPMVVFSGIFLAANRTAQNSATQSDLRGPALAAKGFTCS
jgi:hypothetical protein